MENRLVDLIAYLNTEGWGVQMRASSRGSDGLAEISEEDAKRVYIPLLNEEQREAFKPYIESLKGGGSALHSLVKKLIKEERLSYTEPNRRPSHVVLV